MPCNCCQITDRTFGEADARASLKRYRKRGPDAQTRRLLDAVRSRGLMNAALIDVGGGVGAIYEELLGDTVSEATHVDASSAYLRAAQDEAARRGNSSRVRFLHADFAEVAPELPPADLVTLDRVVCCYPDFRTLLSAAAGRARRMLAMSYPREVWYARMGITVIDLVQAVRRDPFRVFVHSITEMDAVLRENGLKRVSRQHLAFWEVALYERA